MINSLKLKKATPWVLVILTLAVTAFIFLQSADNGPASSEKSDIVVEVVEKVAEKMGAEITDRDSVVRAVRKTAHFLEFAVLGLAASATVAAFKASAAVRAVVPVIYCLAVASADEYLQTFSPGRAGLISDVFIDICGAYAAIILFLLIELAVWHIRARRLGKSPS